MNKTNRNTDTRLYEPSMVKEALCRHFKMASDKSHLAASEKRFTGLGGGQIHYYLFTLEDGRVARQAFGKLGGPNEREYQALQHLTQRIPEEQGLFCRPITLLKEGNRTLLLLEYLEGYVNAFTLRHSLRMFPNRASNITKLGKAILDRIYCLQKHFPIAYRPISATDTDATPGQPSPIGVLKQLEGIKSLSSETKSALGGRVSDILKNEIAVRRGVIHGQLGMRNIMVKGSNIAFIDWEYMEPEGLCLFDPCYIVTMILMRSIQFFVLRPNLDRISSSLFQHIENLEERVADAQSKRSIHDGLWLAKCLALIDTLWSYERTESGPLKALLTQERRKIDYLAQCLEQIAMNDERATMPAGAMFESLVS